MLELCEYNKAEMLRGCGKKKIRKEDKLMDDNKKFSVDAS